MRSLLQPLLSLSGLVWTLTCLVLSVPATAASDSAYEKQIEIAKALAQENSWSKACEAYAAARTLTNDPTALRWCDLWELDATWRGEREPNWNDREAAIARRRAQFEALLKPYADGASKDSFWYAVLSSQSSWEEKFQLESYWEHFRELADFVGSAPPSNQAANNYVAFLKQALSRADSRKLRWANERGVAPYLAAGVRLATNGSDRAWCAWFEARLQQNEEFPAAALHERLEARSERWNACIRLSSGTEWEEAIRAEDFIWRTRLGWDPSAAAGTPADIAARLTDLSRLKTALESQTASAINADLITQLTYLEKSLSTPVLNLQMSAQFDTSASVAFSYGAAGFGRLHFTLGAMKPKDWMVEAMETNPRMPDQTRSIIKEWVQEFSDAPERRWHGETVALESDLKPGFYVLTIDGDQPASGERVIREQLFLVSNIWGYLAADSAKSAKLFACSRSDGRPIADTAVEGETIVPHSGLHEVWSGTTAADGSFSFGHGRLDLQTGFAGTVGGQPFYCSNYLYNLESDASAEAELIFDRPIYRPGETVQWKLFVRERKEGRLVVPEARSRYLLQAELGDEALEIDQGSDLNSFGTAHGVIVIPENVRPGLVNMTLSLSKPGAKAESVRLYSAFQVDRFVAPAVLAKVELASGAQSLRPGKELSLRVKADYFSGGPLVEAPVQGSFHFEYPSYQIPENVREAFSKWQRETGGRPFKVLTDSDGFAVFKIGLPVFVPDGFKVQFNALVLPVGGQPVSADAAYSITSTGVSVESLGWDRIRMANPGAHVVFTGRLVDGANQPVSRKVHADLVELRWSESWLGPFGEVATGEQMAAMRVKTDGAPGLFAAVRDEPNPRGWRRTFAGYLEHSVSTVQIQSGADGKFEVPFDLPESGLFQMRLQDNLGNVLPDLRQQPYYRRVFGQDSDYTLLPSESTRVASEAFAVYVPGRDLNSPFSPKVSLLAVTDPVETGSPFVARAVVPSGTTRAWVTVCGDDKTVSVPLELKGRVGTATLVSPPHVVGQGSVHVSYVSQYGQEGTLEEVFAGPEDKSRLSVIVKPRETVQKPGGDTVVKVQVADAKGKPVRAELAFSVADQAVLRLVGEDEESAFANTFRSGRRLNARMAVFGAVQVGTKVSISDNREGAVLNPDALLYQDEEMLELSPFEIDTAGEAGYTARSTLAGSRVRTEVGASGRRASLVSSELFADFSAAAMKDLLDYTSNTEVGGVAGNFSAPQITLRRHFSSTAFWNPETVTDDNGEATVSFEYPDNLTQWRFDAYAAGEDGASLGHASALVQTSLPLQARLELPRFLVAGDSAQATAALVNRAGKDLFANAMLRVSGAASLVNDAKEVRSGIPVQEQNEAHVFWNLKAKSTGTTDVTLVAHAEAASDAMRLSLPILEDGLQQKSSVAGRLASNAKRQKLELALPAKLDPLRTQVSLQLSQSHAAAILDALPYLVDYPYGCVEQTMSRFLPAVIAQKTLTELGLKAAEVDKRIAAGESPADLARRSHTAGLGEIHEVARRSIERLNLAQREDGGFGWWPDAPATDLWMTAYVSWGLALSKSAGFQAPDELEESSRRALASALGAATADRDTQAWALAALARGSEANPLDREIETRFAQLYSSRESLSAYGRACLTLASMKFGTDDQRNVLVRNLENGLQRDTYGEAVHWGLTDTAIRATDNAVEVTALTLLALLESDPGNALVDQAANWLVSNRRSAHWQSTRETAFAVLALSKYISQRDDLGGTVEAEIVVNRQSVGVVTLGRDSILKGPVVLPIPQTRLRPGANQIEVRRKSGSGPCYAVAFSSTWVAGDAVKPAGRQLTVDRSLTRQAMAPTLLGFMRVNPQPLLSRGEVTVGERVTASVVLNVATDLDYVMIEVPKPAGCEPVNPLSGWDAVISKVQKPVGLPAGRRESMSVYRESGDEKSVFFLDRLPAGEWELQFEMRAVTSGDFRALPAVATAIYVPEIVGNSDSRRLVIVAGEPTKP